MVIVLPFLLPLLLQIRAMSTMGNQHIDVSNTEKHFAHTCIQRLRCLSSLNSLRVWVPIPPNMSPPDQSTIPCSNCHFILLTAINLMASIGSLYTLLSHSTLTSKHFFPTHKYLPETRVLRDISLYKLGRQCQPREAQYMLNHHYKYPHSTSTRHTIETKVCKSVSKSYSNIIITLDQNSEANTNQLLGWNRYLSMTASFMRPACLVRTIPMDDIVTLTAI